MVRPNDSNKNRKPILLKDQISIESSFTIKEEDLVHQTPWHFHPEVELVYYINAKGTNIIGNYVDKIENGELLLIGKNLPHTRNRDKDYYLAHPYENAESIVLRFKEDFLGENFFAIKEFMHIEILLKRAQRGMKFYGKTSDLIFKILRANINGSGLPVLKQVLSLLDIMGKSEEFDFLNAISFVSDPNNLDSQKINKVFQYTETHFREQVSLAAVAALVNITEAAFCRYFKVRTGKSYFQYLTEYRISNACRMLMEEDKDIAEVCFLSGFNNPSNFHKQFKKIVQLTPKQYREKGKKKNLLST